MRVWLVSICTLLLLSSGINQEVLTAPQILKKAEQKLISSTMISTLEVEVKRPKWTKTMELKTWAKGSDYALAYVLAPTKDSGTVYLKSKTEVYNYLPKIKKTVKLPATLLSQNFLGTDLTNDDLVKLSQLTKHYTATLDGTDTVSKRPCHKITLMPKPTADVIWGKIELSIDKKDFIQLQALFYDEDLVPINLMVGGAIKKFGSRTLASKYIIRPVAKKNQYSFVRYKSIEFDKPISADFFTKANMTKVTP